MSAPGMTPGPWRVCEDLHGELTRVCDMTERNGVPGLVANVLMDADARAIAAVPEMVAALEGLIGWAEFMGGWESPAWDAARAALSKARGEEPHCPGCGFPTDGPGTCEACEEGGKDA